MKGSPFKIYNASAGSGKTYALSRAYLKIVLSSPGSFTRILAITFTNKAVNEMKKRILDSLFDFSNTSDISEASPLFIDVMTDLGVTQNVLKETSEHRLKELLHNYAFFDISTIDKFTHRLIRTFAKDLKIPQNFEVVLDTDTLLEEAVSRIISKAGKDSELTKVLMDFALEKIDDNRSWDIEYDLKKIGKLLFNENNVDHIKNLEDKSITDFSHLKKGISKNINGLKKTIIDKADIILKLISENNLTFKDFTGAYFPKFIVKIAAGDLKQDFQSGWKISFDTKPLYNKSCKEPTKSTLDRLHPEFIVLFRGIETCMIQYNFLNNVYRNLVPLTLLNAIRIEVSKIEKEKDQLSISRFNTLISNEIKNQPAPFIYERLGEKYRHYFIDEFQDTSKMQWDNLIPLIGNALESEDERGHLGSLFLVGDTKQAIYRWRGGQAEQFLKLATLTSNPFSIQGETINLPRNYRSYDEIINFNNSFFQSISDYLENPNYKQFFIEGNKQETNAKHGGYVHLSFLEDATDDEYGLKTIGHIKECIDSGFEYKDICILVRKKKHGVLLANYLMKERIPVVSSESLLLTNNRKVQFLIDLAKHVVQPKDAELCYHILDFLSQKVEDKHLYIYSNLNGVEELLFKSYNFDSSFFKQSSIYDAFEHAIKIFDLAPSSNAHLTAFMDTVFEVQQNIGADIQTLLDYWEQKGNKISISTPDMLNAVQIMTIHKSKGLEFPVVIFPFANTNIFEEIDPKLWVRTNSESFSRFKELLISKKKEVKDYGEEEAGLFDMEQQQLHLDAYNLLYVALTRAESVLYIVSKKDITASGSYKPDYFSGLFIHYLQSKGIWHNEKLDYNFGSMPVYNSVPLQSDSYSEIPFGYTFKNRPSFKILTKAGMLWDTTQEEAINHGNTVHYILSLIEYESDVDQALERALQKGLLPFKELQIVKAKIVQVVTHPKLISLYRAPYQVYNEKEILLKTGEKLIPDRINILENTASIIDYKTGEKSPKHSAQLFSYANALEEMGFDVEKKIIVYIDDKISIDII